MKIVLTAVSAFIGTNLDDIFILMLLFSQCKDKKQQQCVAAGQHMGIITLTFISILSAAGIKLLILKYIGLLGVIPVILGVKQWFEYRNANEDSINFNIADSSNIILNTAFITLSNGADNLGVYIPLFSGFGSVELLYTVIIFLIMTSFWCFLGKKISDLPVIDNFLSE